MKKKTPFYLLWVTLWGISCGASAVPVWDNTPTDESRRALQNSAREVNSLLEQQSFQRLEKQRRARPTGLRQPNYVRIRRVCRSVASI
nr:hypothetical protein [Edwardsiella ictaluri]